MNTSAASRNLIAIILAGIVAIAGLYWFFTRPAVNELNAVRAETAVAMSGTAELQGRLANIENGGVDTTQQSFAAAQRLDALLPNEANQSFLLTTLPSQARALGASDFVFNPVSSEATVDPSAPGLSYVEYTTTISGSYATITSWVDAIQTGSPLITITGPSITATTDESGATSYTLDSTLRVWTSSAAPLPTEQTASPDTSAPNTAPVSPPVSPPSGAPVAP